MGMSDGLDGEITDGRDNAGRFGTGNTYGKGRPKRSVELDYMNALHEECPVETWKEIVKKAVEQANGGDAKARTFIANYILGKPQTNIELHTHSEGEPPVKIIAVEGWVPWGSLPTNETESVNG